jgi:uncharacterized protein (TIGR03382 family)
VDASPSSAVGAGALGLLAFAGLRRRKSRR